MTDSAEWFRSIISGRRRGLRAMLWRSLLWWARIPYGVGVAVRNQMYDRQWKRSTRVEVPVVSIGNLTLGGTGKTPCVEWVARFYLENGLVAPILSRGYGSSSGPNDEALVLEENIGVPHLQGADRVELARTAIEELEADVLILDDGFQHRRLARDLDVVLVDVSEPWQYLFPRGTLREGYASLRRASIIVLTRCDQVDAGKLANDRQRLAAYNPNIPIVSTVHRPLELRGEGERRETLESLNGRTIAAFCGIGHPESFRRTLSDLGANLCDFRTYADHHPYSREDVEALSAWANRLPADAWVLTTQKDAVKLRLVELGGRPLWSLPIGMAFLDGQDVFEEALLRVVSV